VTAFENPRAPLPAERAEPLALLSIAAFAALVVGLPVARLLWMAGPRAFGQALDLYGAELLEGVPVTLGSAALATALAALALGRSGRPSTLAAMLAWIPLAVPGTALGAALIETYNRPGLEAVYGSRWILVIAAVARFFPIAYFSLAAHLRTIPGELWEATDLAGLSRARWLARVYLPLAGPGLALAASAVTIFQSGEVAAAVLLAPPGHRPVPVAIASELHYNVNLDVPAALCLFQSAVVLMMIGAIRIPARILTAGARRGHSNSVPGG
jgi:iron(III) transport system permease protein